MYKLKFKTLLTKLTFLARNGIFSTGNLARNGISWRGFVCTMRISSRRVERIQTKKYIYSEKEAYHVKQSFAQVRFCFWAAGLGVNFAPRISARPPANENIVNPAQSAGPVTNESQPAVVTTPASSASASSIESNPAAPASPASTVSPNQRPRKKFHYVEAR
jgi:hypothetical protein